MINIGERTNGEHNLRNSSLELLRLIAIVAIIGHHFMVHGVFAPDILTKEVIKSSFDYSIAFDSLFIFGGTFGNSCFLLITGYFMIKKAVNWKRMLLLIITMYFYYWVILLLFGSFNLANITWKYIVKAVAPFLFGANWFVCCYIVFSLFIPYINLFLTSLTKRQYCVFLKIVFLLGFLLPSFKITTYFVAQEIILFGIMYAFGAYFRLYKLNGRYSKIGFWNKLIVIDSILLMIVPIVSSMFVGKPDIFTGLLGAILAISLFVRFILHPPFINCIINKLAQSVLGVYLIHDNEFIRHFLWRDCFPNISYLHTYMMIPIFIIKVFGVFILCTLIDQIRLIIIEKRISVWLDCHWISIVKKCQKLCNLKKDI